MKEMQARFQRIHNQLEAQVEAAVRSIGKIEKHGPGMYVSQFMYFSCCAVLHYLVSMKQGVLAH